MDTLDSFNLQQVIRDVNWKINILHDFFKINRRITHVVHGNDRKWESIVSGDSDYSCIIRSVRIGISIFVKRGRMKCVQSSE